MISILSPVCISTTQAFVPDLTIPITETEGPHSRRRDKRKSLTSDQRSWKRAARTERRACETQHAFTKIPFEAYIDQRRIVEIGDDRG